MVHSNATVQYNSYGSTNSTWSGSVGPLNGSGTETGNVLLTADPGFVDYTGNNYRLTSAARSLVIDCSSGSTQTVDITNTSRLELDRLAYNSGLNDNGCYETSFWTPTTNEQADPGDFIIRTIPNANRSHNRLKIESGGISPNRLQN